MVESGVMSGEWCHNGNIVTISVYDYCELFANV